MQKHVNLVDLVKGFPTTICLQRFVSIQPRTSLSKFAKKSPKVRKKVRNIIGEEAPPVKIGAITLKIVKVGGENAGLFV